MHQDIIISQISKATQDKSNTTQISNSYKLKLGKYQDINLTNIKSNRTQISNSYKIKLGTYQDIIILQI